MKISKKLLRAVAQAFPIARIHTYQQLQVCRHLLRHGHNLISPLQERIAGGHTVLVPHINLLAHGLQGKPQCQCGTNGIAIRAEMRRDPNRATLLYEGIEILVHAGI